MNNDLPIHEQCTKHDFKCQNIQDLKADQLRLWDKIGDFMSTRTILAIMGITSTLTLAIFGYSVKMNMQAISGSRSRHNLQQLSVDKMMDSQHMLHLQITSMQGTLHEVQNDVEDLKLQGKERKNAKD